MSEQLGLRGSTVGAVLAGHRPLPAVGGHVVHHVLLAVSTIALFPTSWTLNKETTVGATHRLQKHQHILASELYHSLPPTYWQLSTWPSFHHHKCSMKFLCHCSKYRESTTVCALFLNTKFTSRQLVSGWFPVPVTPRNKATQQYLDEELLYGSSDSLSCWPGEDNVGTGKASPPYGLGSAGSGPGGCWRHGHTEHKDAVWREATGGADSRLRGARRPHPAMTTHPPWVTWPAHELQGHWQTALAPTPRNTHSPKCPKLNTQPQSMRKLPPDYICDIPGQAKW